jgi:hypothetical protein
MTMMRMRLTAKAVCDLIISISLFAPVRPNIGLGKSMMM